MQSASPAQLSPDAWASQRVGHLSPEWRFLPTRPHWMFSVAMAIRRPWRPLLLHATCYYVKYRCIHEVLGKWFAELLLWQIQVHVLQKWLLSCDCIQGLEKWVWSLMLLHWDGGVLEEYSSQRQRAYSLQKTGHSISAVQHCVGYLSDWELVLDFSTFGGNPVL